ncbi:hypothetical protein MUU72_06755 [Streptomyces sp. RS10V-4]|uniref:hypothetical protein n=1 Tax=Streptomyces rhizoryzae TaxID=2932493 RepID=UPI0020062D11|nr:hypothetical protein [Streptomyces rhizoryzae]MCK7622806.1 hypothetical protein [Streptomyces rhizoryzae]
MEGAGVVPARVQIAELRGHRRLVRVGAEGVLDVPPHRLAVAEEVQVLLVLRDAHQLGAGEGHRAAGAGGDLCQEARVVLRHVVDVLGVYRDGRAEVREPGDQVPARQLLVQAARRHRGDPGQHLGGLLRGHHAQPDQPLGQVPHRLLPHTAKCRSDH